MVLDFERRAEHGEEAVAAIRDEGAAVVEDRVARLVEVVIQRLDHELGRDGSEKDVKPRRSVNMTVPTGADTPEPEIVGGPREHVVDDVLGQEPEKTSWTRARSTSRRVRSRSRR